MRLKTYATSPRVVAVLAVAAMLTAFVAEIAHSSRLPTVPAYRQIPVATLRDDQAAAALDGQRIWITGGITYGERNDVLIVPFGGDHPNYGPFIHLVQPQKLPTPTPFARDPLEPYGLFHAAPASLDVAGNLDHSASPSSGSPIARSAVALAIAMLLWAACLAIWRALHRHRQWQLGPGVCLGCGYDLRASAGRCPECGRRVSSGSPAVA